MSQENKIKISKQRDVRTYAEMWHTSRVLLQKGLDEPKGCNHQFMASLVFTAFTFEAYLNQIGKKIFSCWKSIEKLSPKDKLNVIAEKIELEVDYGKRPWQTIKDLFRFRNDIAHGKSEKITEKIAIANNDFADSKINEFSRTKWKNTVRKKMQFVQGRMLRLWLRSYIRLPVSQENILSSEECRNQLLCLANKPKHVGSGQPNYSLAGLSIGYSRVSMS